MSETFHYDSQRDAYLLQGGETDARYRIVVPKDLIDDERGGSPTEDERIDWLRSHLPDIIHAYTARIGGGYVQEPWSRVLVEEID